MGVIIRGSYLGDKKVKLLHEPSGVEISTAAPVDNAGDGSSFSPTDLTAASLGSCMMTIMGICADQENINIEGMRMQIEKLMADDPRSIGALPVQIHLPQAITQTQRELLEKRAKNCPVCNSLSENVEVTVEFIYDV